MTVLLSMGLVMLALAYDGSAHAANLVQNGEFESPAGVVDAGQFTSIPGWTTTDTSFEIWQEGFLSSPATGSDALPTGQHLEITSDFQATISQSFVIPADITSATLSFDWWPRSGTDQLRYSVSGTVTGSILPQTDTGQSPNPTGWTAVTHLNLAVVPGETVTLSFTPTPLLPGEAHLDQVAFNTAEQTAGTVPEPGSFLLAAVGLGGLAIRRKK